MYINYYAVNSFNKIHYFLCPVLRYDSRGHTSTSGHFEAKRRVPPLRVSKPAPARSCVRTTNAARRTSLSTIATPVMQFEYDPDRLIEEVKKRPGIWDFDHPDYRTKNMRFHLWNEVVTQLMQPNIKLSKSEVRELEIQLQKKWKSIRDCFQKYLLRPNKTRRPYLYAKQLQFLLKDQDVPRKEELDDGGSSESDDDSRKKRAWRSKKKLKLVKDEEQSSDDDNNADVDTMDDGRDESNEGIEIDIPQMKIPRSNRSHTDEFVFANVDAQSKNDDDPDRLFLLSLLPHLKTVPEEFRLNVKMELMQVLRNANYATAKEHKII